MADPALTLRWEAAPAGSRGGLEPGQLAGLEWVAAPVPGTVAELLRDRGEPWERRRLDDEEWWYRADFDTPAGSYLLELDGLATVCDAWVDDRHVLHSENMFRTHRMPLELDGGDHRILLRFASLTDRLRPRRPRPRWRTFLVDHQSLRWVRTSLLGRMPEWTLAAVPLGPYRPIRLQPAPPRRVVSRELVTSCLDDGSGRVELTAVVETAGEPVGPATLSAAGEVAPVRTERNDSGGWTLTAALEIPGVERWWPHTHGPQPLYDVELRVGDEVLDRYRVGFRTIEVDRSDGGFRVCVNGTPVFCRGAGWMPTDPVSLRESPDDLRATFDLFVAANFNMIRFVGTTVYPSDALLDLCDERGVLVWQDCMLAHLDPPDDPGFREEVGHELAGHFRRLQGRPSLAVVCGSTEVEEQAYMLGLDRADWTFPLLDDDIPALVERHLPGAAYVRSTPTGGANPMSMDQGLSHYFGVGGFLQPFTDARRAGVRFSTECLMFAVPPEPSSVEDGFGADFKAGHDPAWKATLHRDTGRSSDTEDYVSFYLRRLFEVDPILLRHTRPGRALDLSRATVAEAMTAVLTEFRVNPRCDGALLLALRDLRPGAGFGVVDAAGRPKAPWFVLRRLFEPVAVLLSDEGLNGLAVHVANDTRSLLSGQLSMSLLADGCLEIDRGVLDVQVPPRSVVSWRSEEFFGSFRDVTYAYRFTRPAHDVVSVALSAATTGGAAMTRQEYFLPLGPARPQEHDLGLQARARPAEGGEWEVEVGTDRFAQYVALDIPGYLPSDSWFHLGPAATRTLRLTPAGPTGAPAGEVRAPTGEVRALNAVVTARLERP